MRRNTSPVCNPESTRDCLLKVVTRVLAITVWHDLLVGIMYSESKNIYQGYAVNFYGFAILVHGMIINRSFLLPLRLPCYLSPSDICGYRP